MADGDRLVGILGIVVPAVVTLVLELLRRKWAEEDRADRSAHGIAPSFKRAKKRSRAGVAATARNLSLVVVVGFACGMLFRSGIGIDAPKTGRLPNRTPQPQEAIHIAFRQTPPFGQGDPVRTERISGTVTGASASDYRIVLYAFDDIWFVQPFETDPFTNIQPDGTWQNITHPGEKYAALLVRPSFVPPSRSQALPGGADVVVSLIVPDNREQ
jgi:hypothetical protein